MPDPFEEITAVETELSSFADTTLQQIGEVRGNRDLTADARAARIQTIQREAETTIGELAQRASRMATGIITTAGEVESRFVPDESEATARRIEEAEARTRVRDLLDAGSAPVQVITRALEARDRAALGALAAEIQWRAADNPNLDVAGIRRMIFEAEMSLAPEELATARRRRLDAETVLQHITARADLTRKRINGESTIGDAVRLRQSASTT